MLCLVYFGRSYYLILPSQLWKLSWSREGELSKYVALENAYYNDMSDLRPIHTYVKDGYRYVWSVSHILSVGFVRVFT